MNEPIFIWIRRTTDWADEAAFRAQLDPRFLGRVDLWDVTFTMPYREFRSRLRRIAAGQLEKVAGAVVETWERIPENGWVVPIDDDDWLAPHAARRLGEEVRDGMHGIVWSQLVLEVPIDLGHRVSLACRRLLKLPPRWFIATNNSMLRKGAAPQESFQFHTRASRRYQGSSQVCVLPDHLSIQNRSLASITSLGFGRRNFCRTDLLAKYRRYRRLYRAYAPPSPDAAWLAAPVAEMARLMDDLVPR